MRVPRDALVGKVNDGWNILTSALATERLLMGGSIAMIRKKFSYLIDAMRKSIIRKKPSHARAYRGTRCRNEVARQLGISRIHISESGRVPVVEAAMSSVFSSESMQRLGESALDIPGTSATLYMGSKGAAEGGLEQMLRESIMWWWGRNERYSAQHHCTERIGTSTLTATTRLVIALLVFWITCLCSHLLRSA